MSQNLTSRTLNGFKWSTTATITNSVMQIGYMAIMARLLDPVAFGLVAMAGLVLRFGSYFANMGMSQALIQKKELYAEDIRAAFTASLFLGLFFWGLVWLLAPLSIYIFDNKEIIPIVRVMGGSFLLSALTSTSHSLLRRDLNFKFIAIIEVLSYLIAYVGIGIILAYNDFGVWSLVYAGLSQSAIWAIVLYLFTRHTIRPIFTWKYYQPLLAFGGKISFISFLEYFGSNLDTLAIGHFLGASILGIYNRAFILIQTPIQNLTSSISRVLFPALSTIQSQTERLKKVYLSSISLVGYIIIPACIGASVAGEHLVLVLLGEKWSEAIPIFQVLAFVTPLNLLSHFGGVVCDARGALNLKVVLQIIFPIVLCMLFYILSSYGLIGFAYALVIAELLRNIAYIFMTKSFLHYTWAEIARSYLPSILSGSIVGLSIFIFQNIINVTNLPLTLILIFEIILGAIILIGLLFFNYNKNVRTEIMERLAKGFVTDNKRLNNIIKVLGN